MKMTKNGILLISVLALSSVAVAQSGTTASANPVANTASTQAKAVSYLYVQAAANGSIKKNADQNSYTLTLNGVSPQTIQFADRPARIVNPVSTADFFNTWDDGKPNSFAAVNPNAVLSYTENHELRTMEVVELSKPTYDQKTNVVTYQIIPIDKKVQLAEKIMKRPSLFIDDNCVGGLGCWD